MSLLAQLVEFSTSELTNNLKPNPLNSNMDAGQSTSRMKNQMNSSNKRYVGITINKRKSEDRLCKQKSKKLCLSETNSSESEGDLFEEVFL